MTTLLLLFAAAVLLRPINRASLCLFGIGESSTKTNVNTTRIDAPVTADAGSIAGRNVRSDVLDEHATQINLGQNARLTINQSTESNSDLDLIRDIVSQQNQFVSQADERLDTLLGSLGSIASSTQTGGETDRDKTILWVVVAFAVVLFFRR